MSVEDIIQKWNYNEEITNFLRKAYPELVAYFNNEENIVYRALMDTEIAITDGDNLYNFLEKKGFLEGRVDNEMVSFEALKVSLGVYDSVPDITYNETLNTYSINGIKRIVVQNAYNLKQDCNKLNLVHEISHLIKAYKNEYVIKGDTLIVRSGLITRIYQLSYKDGKVQKTLWKEFGVGLEEGLNSLAEETITSNAFGRPYKTKGYTTMKALVQNIINAYNIPNLKEIFIEAELYHDNSRIDSVLGEVFYELRAFADKLYPLNVKILNMNITKEERDQIVKEMDALIKAEYEPLTEKLKAIGQGSMEM